MAAAPVPSRLYRVLSRHWWLSLLLMGISFVCFGLASLNLLQMLGANLSFLARHGIDAVREGGLLQLLELVVSGYAAAVFYIFFRLCEKALVDRLAYVVPRDGAVSATEGNLS
ncbi:hypothetical protein [Piscinibacter sakaiensis]|uniref:hypothetical protein n=1 Tax=Piscinibacter sakaiensis TaxID=1547922 RepID=UPI003AAC49AE